MPENLKQGKKVPDFLTPHSPLRITNCAPSFHTHLCCNVWTKILSHGNGWTLTVRFRIKRYNQKSLAPWFLFKVVKISGKWTEYL